MLCSVCSQEHETEGDICQQCKDKMLLPDIEPKIKRARKPKVKQEIDPKTKQDPLSDIKPKTRRSTKQVAMSETKPETAEVVTPANKQVLVELVAESPARAEIEPDTKLKPKRKPRAEMIADDGIDAEMELLVQPESTATQSGIVKGKTMINAMIVVVILILLAVIGIPRYTMSSAENKDKAVIEQAQNLLADGYTENQDMTKVNWGKYEEAKRVLSTLAATSKARKDADVILGEISAREAGAHISQAQRIILHMEAPSIETLKRLRDELAYIQPSNRYYQQAQNTLPICIDVLASLLIQKAKQNLESGNFVEVRKYLVDVNPNSKFKPEVMAIDKAAYIKSLGEFFVRQGIRDVKIMISGNDNDHLVLTYGQWSKPIVVKFVEDNGVLKNAKALGFKRVSFDTGNREAFRYDL